MLNQVGAKSNQLGLTCTDLVLDHAIYSKALEAINNPINQHLKDVINLRMGGFHACGIFLAVIGKRFGSAGLKDLIIEANLAGTDSTDCILKGKHYNRGVRIMKYVYEALQRLKIEKFNEWLQTEERGNPVEKFTSSEVFNNLLQERKPASIQAGMNDIEDLACLFKEYEEKLRNQEFGPMAAFWQSFIDMVQILLDFIRAVRGGDWDMHLETCQRMLVWIHAYDRINYSRHFTYYWASQQSIEERFPSIYQEFKNGNFSTKRTPGKFNMLPPDQVIEQTINRDQKGSGGIKHISASIGLVQRWVLSSHNTSTIVADMRKGIGLDNSNVIPKDLNCKRIDFDETCVRNCQEVIGKEILFKQVLWFSFFSANEKTVTFGIS